jgi:hypothetical protein
LSDAHAALAPVAAGSRDYAILEPWAFTLAGLGRREQALAVVKQLDAIGYRNPAFIGAVTRGGLAQSPRAPVNRARKE